MPAMPCYATRVGARECYSNCNSDYAVQLLLQMP